MSRHQDQLLLRVNWYNHRVDRSDWVFLGIGIHITDNEEVGSPLPVGSVASQATKAIAGFFLVWLQLP